MRRILRYRLRLRSPGRFGTGVTGADFDELVLRHPDGYPMIAGARIKGSVRDELLIEELDPDGILDRVMGKPDSDGGVLWFSDAKPIAELREMTLTGARNRVRLGDHRSAEVGGLRRIEVVEPFAAETLLATVFEGEVALLPGRTDEKALDLVERGLAYLEYLGGGTNHGPGRVEVAIEPEGGAAPRRVTARPAYEARPGNAGGDRVMALMLTIEAEGDLLMRDRQRRSNVLRSDPFIRGSILRGAIADAWINAGKGTGKDFRDLFAGKVEFRGGYPRLGDGFAMTTPATIFRSKDDGAYLDMAWGNDKPYGYKRVGGLARVVTAPDGSVTAEPVQDDFIYGRQRVGTKQDGSGMIDSEDPGKLFTEVVVASGTTFTVEIRGPEKHLESLLRFFNMDKVEWRLTLGRSRTVLGMCEVVAFELAEIPTRSAVEGDRHALLFEAETILLDQYLEPVLPSIAWLAELAGLDEPKEIEDFDISEVRQTAIAGWSGVHRGPKPIDIAIERGSVLTFKCSDVGGLKRLAGLQTVGWRRSEGFGVVRLDHPIHGAGWPTSIGTLAAPDVEAVDDAQAAMELAGDLFALGVGYSEWSAFREAEGVTIPTRAAASTHPQAMSGLSAGIAKKKGERQVALANAFQQAHYVGSKEEFKRSVARELHLLEIDRRNMASVPLAAEQAEQ